METDLWADALRVVAARRDAPQVGATDPEAQSSSAEFVAEVSRIGVRRNMDGRGCSRDNLFVERLCRNVKHDEVHLKAYDVFSAPPGPGGLLLLQQHAPTAPVAGWAHARHDLLRQHAPMAAPA